MKLPVIGLFALGAAAAVAAAILVASLKSSSRREAVVSEEDSPPPTVKILVAAKDQAALTVLGADCVEQREVEANVAPEGSFSDPVQVVGRVLQVPVKAGQVFKPELFASEGSNFHLASALQAGKRAINVHLSDAMGLEELLYPGSIVDVLVSIKASGGEEAIAETMSVTLLQGVTVLAVGERTVVAPELENEDTDFVVSRGNRPKVTLLVDPEDAQLIQLAMNNGSVSLSMRNPMDESRTTHDGTRLTDLSPILAAVEQRKLLQAREEALEKAREEARKATLVAYDLERARFDNERDQAKIEIDREKLALEKYQAEQARLQEGLPTWETTIIRGGVIQTKTFPGVAVPPQY